MKFLVLVGLEEASYQIYNLACHAGEVIFTEMSRMITVKGTNLRHRFNLGLLLSW